MTKYETFRALESMCAENVEFAEKLNYVKQICKAKGYYIALQPIIRCDRFLRCPNCNYLPMIRRDNWICVTYPTCVEKIPIKGDVKKVNLHYNAFKCFCPKCGMFVVNSKKAKVGEMESEIRQNWNY